MANGEKKSPEKELVGAMATTKARAHTGEFPSVEMAVVAANQKEGVGCGVGGDDKGE